MEEQHVLQAVSPILTIDSSCSHTIVLLTHRKQVILYCKFVIYLFFLIRLGIVANIKYDAPLITSSLMCVQQEVEAVQAPRGVVVLQVQNDERNTTQSQLTAADS